MQPYVIKQGDFLAKIAYRFGFDADTVWNDPTNAQLRQLRPDPNLLLPTDVLYIPDQVGKKPTTHNLTAGTTNSFVADVPTTTVTVKFTDQSLASQAYSIQELPELTGQTSGADGTVSFSAPVMLDTATIVFTESGATFAYQMGNLDPIDSLSGIFQRLQHLGFIDPGVPVSFATVEFVRWALLAFKKAQSQDSTSSDAPPPSAPPPSSPPPSSPPSTPSPSSIAPPPAGSDAIPPSSGPAGGSSDAAPASAPPSSGTPSGVPSSPSQDSSDDSQSPSSSPPDSQPPPSSSPDSQPPSSAPPDSGSSAPDNGGLNDDGTLDDETKQLLLSAHGS